MKLKDLFERSIEIGIEHDVRGKKEIQQLLKKQKEKYNEAEGREKKLFDTERLWNPFHDSRILNGTGNEEIQCMFVGIDIEVDQMLLADRLRERGEKIDCLFMHHPQGRASVEMANDMYLQMELYRKYEVPIVHIEQQLHTKIEATYRSSHGDNVFEWQRSAEHLKFPALCVHTPADNLVYQFIEKYISEKKYKNIGELVNAILEIPEFYSYAEQGMGPVLINCDSERKTGVIAPTGITGGTDGPEVFVKEQAAAGVGTILVMHASDQYKQMAEQYHLNIIQLSHYAADDLGMNLLLDLLEKEDKKLRIIEGCGFQRVKREADVHRAIAKNARQSEAKKEK